MSDDHLFNILSYVQLVIIGVEVICGLCIAHTLYQMHKLHKRHNKR